MAQVTVDSIKPQEYDPRLYAPVKHIDPVSGFASFDEACFEQYRTLGFVSVGDAFTSAECQTSVDALLQLADSELPPGVEIAFEALSTGDVMAMPIQERQDQIRKYMWFRQHDLRFNITAENPELLKVVRELLGAEPEIFQDMALFKPPGIGREKPWHQDHAYFNLPEVTPVVGVWIALDDATLENGCMVFQPGGHRAGPIPHFNRRDWQICDSDILAGDATVAAPLKAGGCLIFDGLTPHGTPMNRSPFRRRALQYHFAPVGTRRTTTEERMELFGSEGRNVTC